jgi:hypothetical protein
MKVGKQSEKNGGRFRGNERGGIINRNILLCIKNLQHNPQSLVIKRMNVY